mgnify:CR=1 FL=1
MLSKFFLERPVFAWVIAIVLMVAGGLAIYNLPISQYPPIAPPSIAIDSFYAGASAETVENSVTQIIEQKMTGFDDMLYLSGTSDSAGASRVEELEAVLAGCGFTDIRIRPKDESREFIRDWAPGRGVEEYVVSATIEAVKP